MDNLIGALFGVAVLAALSLAFMAINHRRHEERVHRIHGWVTDYLINRYGAMPVQLKINCSHDLSRPVLLSFDTPGTEIRHGMQIMCSGERPAWFLLSEKDEAR